MTTIISWYLPSKQSLVGQYLPIKRVVVSGGGAMGGVRGWGDGSVG